MKIPSLLLLISVCLISITTSQSWAESNENYTSLSSEDSTLTISASPSELSAGRKTHVAIIVENNESHEVKLLKIESISPWKITKSFEPPLIIKPNNSDVVTLDVEIPSTVAPDTYTLVVSVVDSNQIAKITHTEIIIKEFDPLKIEISWIVALLSSYLIPAQIIERILEVLRITRPKESTTEKNLQMQVASDQPESQQPQQTYGKFDRLAKEISELEEELDFNEKIRGKIVEHMEGTAAEDGTIPDKSGKPYQNMEMLDSEISKISVKLSKAKKYQATLVWCVSLMMSIIPGGIFAYYDLGILQIIGHNGMIIQIVDGIFNTLFIASGTKPIHDIIKRIKGDG